MHLTTNNAASSARLIAGGVVCAPVLDGVSSAYLLSGPARSEWEHSIPPVDATRYSITFRNLRED